MSKTAKNEIKRDDFTKIKGIGPAWDKWLGNSFQIATYQEFSELDVDEVWNKVQDEGKIQSQDAIISWIAEAKVLAAKKTASAKNKKPVITVSKGSNGEPKKAKKKTSPSRKGGWKPLATFVVEFQSRQHQQVVELQTAVQHMEIDVGNTWPGLEKELLCNWMEKQAQIPILEETIPQPQETKAVGISKETSIALSAKQVKLSQPPKQTITIVENQFKQPFFGHVSHQQPLSIAVDFYVAETSKSPTTLDPSKYSAQCHINDLSTGGTGLLLDMENDLTTNGQPTYGAHLSDLTLKPGMYDLGILVRSLNPLSTTYVKLPKLNVL